MKNKTAVTLLLALMPALSLAAPPEPKTPDVPHVLYYLNRQGIVAMQDFNSLATCKKVSAELSFEAFTKNVPPLLNDCLPK